MGSWRGEGWSRLATSTIVIVRKLVVLENTIITSCQDSVQQTKILIACLVLLLLLIFQILVGMVVMMCSLTPSLPYNPVTRYRAHLHDECLCV